jgi:hypothetical protein
MQPSQRCGTYLNHTKRERFTVDIVLRLVVLLDPVLTAQVERFVAALEAAVTSETIDASALKAATAASAAKTAAIDEAVKANTP